MKKIVVITLAIALMASIAFAKDHSQPVSGTRGLLDCSNAIPIGIYESVVGSNVGLPNNVNNYSCVGWNEAGGEAIYELVLDDDYTVNGTLTGLGTPDLDIFFLDGCEEANCIEYGNTMFTAVVGPGTYYIVVDGFNGDEDIFTLTVHCYPVPDPQPPFEGGETCNDAVDPWEAGVTDFSVDLTTYVDHYDSDCFFYTLPGGDAVYKFDLEAGEEFNVTMEGTCDMALYIMGDCASGESLACSDNTDPGQPESISYVPTFSGTYYLIVDTVWAYASCPVVVHLPGSTSGVEGIGGLPSVTRLTGIYPNPFNPATNVSFELAHDQMVVLDVYDISGRKVRNLASRFFMAGNHSVRWDGRNDSGARVASGVYMARLVSGQTRSQEKFVLVK